VEITMSKRKDDPNLTRPADTGDYSATKAPENRPHVESKVAAAPAQRPGGLFGTPVDVGMSALDRHTVPKMAAEDLASEEIEAAKAQRGDEADDADGADAGSTSRVPSRRG
jgi:hypothetical protein